MRFLLLLAQAGTCQSLHLNLESAWGLPGKNRSGRFLLLFASRPAGGASQRRTLLELVLFVSDLGQCWGNESRAAGGDDSPLEGTSCCVQCSPTPGIFMCVPFPPCFRSKLFFSFVRTLFSFFLCKSFGAHTCGCGPLWSVATGCRW